MKICGNAFNSLQTMLKTQQEELTDKIFETSDETQNMLNDVLSKLSDLDHSINDIKSFNEPHGISQNHLENAKWLIENVKNSEGKSIKGLKITTQNVASILEAYERKMKNKHNKQ